MVSLCQHLATDYSTKFIGLIVKNSKNRFVKLALELYQTSRNKRLLLFQFVRNYSV